MHCPDTCAQPQCAALHSTAACVGVIPPTASSATTLEGLIRWERLDSRRRRALTTGLHSYWRLYEFLPTVVKMLRLNPQRTPQAPAGAKGGLWLFTPPFDPLQIHLPSASHSAEVPEQLSAKRQQLCLFVTSHSCIARGWPRNTPCKRPRPLTIRAILSTVRAQNGSVGERPLAWRPAAPSVLAMLAATPPQSCVTDSFFVGSFFPISENGQPF